MKWKKFIKWWRHPIKNYLKGIKHSIIPKPYSHQVKMNLIIKKGQQSGTALIPCTIYAMDHSLDLNPSLIKKKTKEIIDTRDVKKKFKYISDPRIKSYKIDNRAKEIHYNPNNYVVELSKEEKEQGYHLTELERCKHCGQKVVMAELEQTRYRSCPSINVKLGDKAKEDIVVPVEFGVNKADITRRYWAVPILLFGMVYVSLIMLLNFDMLDYLPTLGTGTPSPVFSILMKIFLVVFIWVLLMPRMLYGTYKMFKWYKEVKPTMRRSKYAVS